MANIFDFNSCADFLRKTLEEKQERNISFSLRAFAQSLGISPSHLSRVLNGQKKLSVILAHQMAQRMRMNQSEANYFVLLARYLAARDDGQKADLEAQLQKKKEISHRRVLGPQTLAEVNNPVCLSVLALASTKDFDSDPRWIATRLGFSETDVTAALEVLLAHGILQRNSEGKIFSDVPPDMSVSEESSAEAISETLTIAANPEDLPRIRDLIRSFIERLSSEINPNEGLEVFQAQVRFSQISHRNKPPV